MVERIIKHAFNDIRGEFDFGTFPTSEEPLRLTKAVKAAFAEEDVVEMSLTYADGSTTTFKVTGVVEE